MIPPKLSTTGSGDSSQSASLRSGRVNDSGDDSPEQDRLGSAARTNQACERCKRRKIKCDRKPTGCDNCKQNNVPCETVDRNTGRTMVRDYVEQLEERVSLLEDRNTHLEQDNSRLTHHVRLLEAEIVRRHTSRTNSIASTANSPLHDPAASIISDGLASPLGYGNMPDGYFSVAPDPAYLSAPVQTLNVYTSSGILPSRPHAAFPIEPTRSFASPPILPSQPNSFLATQTPNFAYCAPDSSTAVAMGWYQQPSVSDKSSSTATVQPQTHPQQWMDDEQHNWQDARPQIQLGRKGSGSGSGNGGGAGGGSSGIS